MHHMTSYHIVAFLGLQCKPTKHDLGNGGVEYRNLAFSVPSQEVRVVGHPKYEQFQLVKKWLHPDRSGNRNQFFHLIAFYKKCLALSKSFYPSFGVSKVAFKLLQHGPLANSLASFASKKNRRDRWSLWKRHYFLRLLFRILFILFIKSSYHAQAEEYRFRNLIPKLSVGLTLKFASWLFHPHPGR